MAAHKAEIVALKAKMHREIRKEKEAMEVDEETEDLGDDEEIDNDWAGNALDRKLTVGYCTYLGTILISWSTKKHTIVAQSYMKPNREFWLRPPLTSSGFAASFKTFKYVYLN